VNFSNATSSLYKWWKQFPKALQLISKASLLVSIGTLVVLYLSPLVCHIVGLLAAQIGSGVSTAAKAGIISEILTVLYLYKKINCLTALRNAALFAI
tara:strand:- start:473 stop:763 length:291 start_codon:yes stop_codon:yes gene_type:complete